MKQLYNAVKAMREKQREYQKSRGKDWSYRNIIKAEATALEQNVDRIIAGMGGEDNADGR